MKILQKLNINMFPKLIIFLGLNLFLLTTYIIIFILIKFILLNSFSIIIDFNSNLKIVSIFILISNFIILGYFCLIFLNKAIINIALFAFFSIFYIAFFPGIQIFDTNNSVIFFIGLFSKYCFNFFLYLSASNFLNLKRSKVMELFILIPTFCILFLGVLSIFFNEVFTFVEVNEKYFIFIMIFFTALIPSFFIFLNKSNYVISKKSSLKDKIYFNLVAITILIISLIRIIDYINFMNGNIVQIYYCYIFPSFFCSIFTFEQLWIFKEKKTQLSRMYLLSSNLSSECLDLLHDGKKLSRSIKKYCSFSKEKNILQLAEKNLLLMESMSNLLELNLIEKTFRENYFSIKNIFEQAAFELELELGTSIDLNFINNNNNDSDFIFSNELFMSRIASNIISNIANHGSKKSAYIEFESCLKSWSFKIKISNYTNLNHINLNSKSRGLSIIKKLTEVQGGSSLIDIKDNIFICQIQIPFKKSVVYI